MLTDQEIEAAAATIFCHAQFKGDDYTARQLAKKVIAAALEARDAEIARLTAAKKAALTIADERGKENAGMRAEVAKRDSYIAQLVEDKDCILEMEAELAKLREIQAELKDAVDLMMKEIAASGNWNAKDFGWPRAVAAAKAVQRHFDGNEQQTRDVDGLR